MKKKITIKDVNRAKLFLYLYSIFNLISIKNTNQQIKQFFALCVIAQSHPLTLSINVTLKYVLRHIQ